MIFDQTLLLFDCYVINKAQLNFQSYICQQSENEKLCRYYDYTNYTIIYS